jgi:hypothetical protein
LQATGFVSLRFTNIVKREFYPSVLPFPAPPSPPTTPSEVTAETQALPMAFWAWTHEDDVIDAHMAALDRPADKVFAATPSLHHASFTIAAPDTRFIEDTEDLLVRHFGPKVAAGIARYVRWAMVMHLPCSNHVFCHSTMPLTSIFNNLTLQFATPPCHSTNTDQTDRW